MTSIDGPLSVYNLAACECVIITWHMILYTLSRAVYWSSLCQNGIFQLFFLIWSQALLLFFWFVSLSPINNLSVIKGQLFLGWTSTKLGLMFLLKDTTQWRRWGSNPRSRDKHSTTALPTSPSATESTPLIIGNHSISGRCRYFSIWKEIHNALCKSPERKWLVEEVWVLTLNSPITTKVVCWNV